MACRASGVVLAFVVKPPSFFRYSLYFCKWLATFSLVMPSTFISCKMVLGTAFFTPCLHMALCLVIQT